MIAPAPGPAPQVLLRQQFRASDVLGEQGLQDALAVGRHPQHPVVLCRPARAGTAPARPSVLRPRGVNPTSGAVADERRPRDRTFAAASRRAVSSSRSVTCQASSSRTTATRSGWPPSPGVWPRTRSAARVQNSTPVRSSSVMNPRPERVVGVVRVVGDANRPHPRPGLRAAAARVAELGALRRVEPLAVLDERLAHLERQVQPGELRVALLQLIDAAQAVQVVVEPADGLRHSSRASSPAWPNGGWPMSWARAIASVRSSLSRSRRATVRRPARLRACASAGCGGGR